MKEGHGLTLDAIRNYMCYLRQEEYAEATLEKYFRDLRAFYAWLDGRAVTKENTAQWKSALLAEGRAPSTVNVKLSALNGLLRFCGWAECAVKFLKIQRQAFRETTRELTRGEYEKLVKTARRLGQDGLALLMETICSTGIRVSEVRHITVEAARAGKAVISLKGKVRVILLPERLCRRLLKYAKKSASGEIFLAKDGSGLTRNQIWRAMKQICEKAGVEPTKVFPHNLRHLFAVSYYKAAHDIVQLADLLGHSSIETTRVYLATTGAEHARRLEKLGLVI